MGQRHLHPQDFLHGIGDQLRPFLIEFALIGELVERVDDAAHGVTSGVVPAHDQQHQIAHEFLRAHLVHRGRVDHHRDEIIARLLVHRPLDPERLEIGRHFLKDAPARFIERAHRAKLGIARPVRPEGQQAAVFPGEAEQDGEHPGGEFDRDGIDPIEHFAARQAVEHFAGALADFGFHLGDGRRGELGRDGAALPGVLRAVHRNEHRQLAALNAHFGQLRIIRPFEDGDPAMLPARREGFGQGLDMLDRLVADHRPIGAERAFGDPVQLARRAHLGEDRLPGILGIDFRAAHIPRVRVSETFFGMGGEVRFERIVRTRLAAHLRALNRGRGGGDGGHVCLPSGSLVHGPLRSESHPQTN